VVAADIDGDGDLDILTANENSHNVSVRLNDGTGTFRGNTSVEVGGRPASVVAADIDGDGDLDILTANGNNVSVRLNNGDGTFNGNTSVAAGNSPASVVAADIDGDGDLDILTANDGNNYVSVRLNQPPPNTVTALSPPRNANAAGRGANVTLSLNRDWPSDEAGRQALTVWSQQAGGKKAGSVRGVALAELRSYY
jgi:hypothetical protein